MFGFSEIIVFIVALAIFILGFGCAYRQGKRQGYEQGYLDGLNRQINIHNGEEQS